MQINADLGLFVSQFLLRKHNNLLAKIKIKTSGAISNFTQGECNFFQERGILLGKFNDRIRKKLFV